MILKKKLDAGNKLELGIKAYSRVVLIPVSENAADTTENAGIGIGEYTSLCTNHIPYNVIY